MMKKYIIKNLDCASCAQKIEDVLNKRNDIIECSISFEMCIRDRNGR